MKILTIDIGTGTQDFFLYNSRLDIENGFKLVIPSPTMIIHSRIKEATRLRQPILLTGVMMGGGPSAWAVEAHLRSGLKVFATSQAARTLNDDLEKVEKLGVTLVSEDEAARLAKSTTVLEFRDLDLPAIRSAFHPFGVTLDDLSAVAVAVFDHGDAPPDISDRQFRFEYLDGRILNRKSSTLHNPLSAFAFLQDDIPPVMTRLQAVAHSAGALDCPLIVMDTAPAAILGATFDSAVSSKPHTMVCNVGNFHTLAFRLGQSEDGALSRIEGLFEHHTGEIDRPKLESLLLRLADGTLNNQDVFDDMGHGALMYEKSPLPLGQGDYDVAVTGPRRSLLAGRKNGGMMLRPYFAVPFGDMMLAGNIGLLAATADVLPELAESIHVSLRNESGKQSAPWEN